MDRSCAICGTTRHDLIYRRSFTKLSGALIGGYDVVACSGCGFCFANDLPSQDELDDYYARQSKYEHDNRAGSPSEYDARRLPFAASIIAEWLPERDSRIVDIGCANGGLLNELRTNGYKQVMGIDPSPGCARTARELYGIDVKVAPISRIPPGIGLFDLVIFGSVMEHLVDLNGAIDRIKTLLKPSGRVFIEVPDMTRCSSLNDAPFQEFSVEHVNYFGPIALENLWKRNGFDTTAIRQTQIEHVPGLTVFEIKAMFQWTKAEAGKVRFDDQTRPEIERYIERARAKLNKIEQTINDLAENQQPIVVWGVGTHTQSLLASSRLREVNIKAFFDSNSRYEGQELCGLPILHPDQLRNWDEPVLISSQQFQQEIADTIQNKMKLSNRLITLYHVPQTIDSNRPPGAR